MLPVLLLQQSDKFWFGVQYAPITTHLKFCKIMCNMKFVCIDNSVLLISVIKYNNGGITMKNLLILTTLSLITMQGFTVWGREETTKEPYEISHSALLECFSSSWNGSSSEYWDSTSDNYKSWGPPTNQSCHKKFEKIVNSFLVNGGNGTTKREVMSQTSMKIENMNDFLSAARLPKNIYLAASLTGEEDILENIDDDHVNDDLNEKTYCPGTGDTKLNALQIAQNAKNFYKDQYEHWKLKEKKDGTYHYAYAIKNNYGEYQRRKKVYEKLKDLKANQCGNEEEIQ